MLKRWGNSCSPTRFVTSCSRGCDQTPDKTLTGERVCLDSKFEGTVHHGHHGGESEAGGVFKAGNQNYLPNDKGCSTMPYVDRKVISWSYPSSDPLKLAQFSLRQVSILELGRLKFEFLT